VQRVARRHGDGLAFGVFHGRELHGSVAGGVDDLDPVAHGKAVLGLHLGPAVRHRLHLADELAARGHRVAGFVVLVVLRRAALQKAAGVAAVGQAFQLGDQLGVEGAAGHRIVDGAAVHLRGARHVVLALGAALDLQRIDADPASFSTSSTARRSLLFMM
jgi:hypothetical protein